MNNKKTFFKNPIVQIVTSSYCVVSTLLVGLPRSSWAVDAQIPGEVMFQTSSQAPDFRGCIDTYHAFRGDVEELDTFTEDTVELLNKSKNPFSEGLAKTAEQGNSLNSSNLSQKSLSELALNGEEKFAEAAGMAQKSLERFASAAQGNNTLSKYMNDCAVMLQERLVNLNDQALSASDVKREIIMLSATVGIMEAGTAAWQWYNENKCAGNTPTSNLDLPKNTKSVTQAADGSLSVVKRIPKVGTETISGDGLMLATPDTKLMAGVDFNGTNALIGAGIGGAAGALVGKKGSKFQATALAASGGALLSNINQVGSLLKNGASIAGNAISSGAKSVGCSDHAVMTRMVAELATTYQMFEGKTNDYLKTASKYEEDFPKVEKARDSLQLLQGVHAAITVKSVAQFGIMKWNAEAYEKCLATANVAGASACSGMLAAFEAQKIAAIASIVALLPTTMSAISKLESAEDQIQANAKEANAFLADYATAVPDLVTNESIILSSNPEAAKMQIAAIKGTEVSEGNNSSYKVFENASPAEIEAYANKNGRSPASLKPLSEALPKAVFSY